MANKGRCKALRDGYGNCTAVCFDLILFLNFLFGSFFLICYLSLLTFSGYSLEVGVAWLAEHFDGSRFLGATCELGDGFAFSSRVEGRDFLNATKV